MSGPLVSIVTPSLQQGRFIERTLESVAVQRDGSLADAIEHIVMDGGSTDGTLEILERWRDRIAFSSGPDGGQTAAINAGLARARGDILAYLNADDLHYAGAIAAAVDAFEKDPQADVVYGDADLIDDDDRLIGSYPTEAWSMERLKLICFLCQPAVFFRRRVIEQFGPFDERLDLCMDYEYWLRLGLRGARFVRIPAKLAAARHHADAKTFRLRRQAHTEINDMLKQRLGTVPDNWLSNHAVAVLDGRRVRRDGGFVYVVRVVMLTIIAALRWRRFPSLSLLRNAAWSARHA